MRDRNKLCIYYERAGKCKKGKGCTAFGEMQHCGLYIKNSKSKNLRPNNKRKKLEEIRKKDKF